MIIISFSYLVVPYTSKKIGNLMPCLVFTLILIPLFVFSSYLNHFTGVEFWVLIIVNHGLIMALFTSYISLISIEISNSVSDDIVGSANGLAQGIVSLFSALGSFIIGGIYGWTLKSKIGFPFDYHFAFFFLDFILVCNIFMTTLSMSKEKVQKYEELELSDLSSNNDE